MFSRYKYYVYGTTAAVVYWFSDSLIDYHLSVVNTFEFIPDDFTELWMRVVIFTQFIVLGAVVQRHVKLLTDANIKLLEEAALRHESELEAQRASAKMLKEHEKAAIYLSTVQATHHIVNNLLNQLQLFKMEAEKTSDFDKDTLKLYDAVTAEATDLVNKLSTVKQITSSDIHNSVHPDKR